MLKMGLFCSHMQDNTWLSAEDFFDETPKKGQKALKISHINDLILHQTNDYLILNKPPHISTLDERAEGFGLGLLRLVKQQWPDAQACHRLDKETSGAIAFAKNPEAYRNLAMQFEHRQVNKVYHAVVNGAHNFEGINVYLPIKAMRGGYVVIDKVEGKEAETIFNTVQIFRGYTLMACYPVTGRMHQIRIHLKCLDAPIVADDLYGGKDIYLSDIKRKFNLKKNTEERPLITRVALHAAELHFTDLQGERLSINAPYPKDITALLEQLRKHA